MKMCDLPLAELLKEHTQHDPDTGCMLWARHKQENGYGLIAFGNGQRRAHRHVWELANGQPVPKGMVVRHLCAVRPCVNPAHLAIGTHADNAADTVEARTGYRPKVPDLTDHEVRIARAMLGNGFSHNEIESAWGLDKGALRIALSHKAGIEHA